MNLFLLCRYLAQETDLIYVWCLLLSDLICVRQCIQVYLKGTMSTKASKDRGTRNKKRHLRKHLSALENEGESSTKSNVEDAVEVNTGRKQSGSCVEDNGEHHTSVENTFSRGRTTFGSNKRIQLETECMLGESEDPPVVEMRKRELSQTDKEESENEDLHFFKSILPHMKELPPLRKLRVRAQMQNILLKELEDLDHSVHKHDENSSKPSTVPKREVV